MSWSIVIARNHCLDRLRARPARVTDDGDLAATVADRGPDAETVLIRQGEARRILDCLATLDPERARAIRSAYLDGETYEGIAKAIGIPLNTLRSWLHRGLRSLRECMEK